jgi:hypothetical protein
VVGHLSAWWGCNSCDNKDGGERSWVKAYPYDVNGLVRQLGAPMLVCGD